MYALWGISMIYHHKKIATLLSCWLLFILKSELFGSILITRIRVYCCIVDSFSFTKVLIKRRNHSKNFHRKEKVHIMRLGLFLFWKVHYLKISERCLEMRKEHCREMNYFGVEKWFTESTVKVSAQEKGTLLGLYNWTLPGSVPL